MIYEDRTKTIIILAVLVTPVLYKLFLLRCSSHETITINYKFIRLSLSFRNKVKKWVIQTNEEMLNFKKRMKIILTNLKN